jgi:hypothetical protein
MYASQIFLEANLRSFDPIVQSLLLLLYDCRQLFFDSVNSRWMFSFIVLTTLIHAHSRHMPGQQDRSKYRHNPARASTQLSGETIVIAAPFI